MTRVFIISIVVIAGLAACKQEAAPPKHAEVAAPTQPPAAPAASGAVGAPTPAAGQAVPAQGGTALRPGLTFAEHAGAVASKGAEHDHSKCDNATGGCAQAGCAEKKAIAEKAFAAGSRSFGAALPEGEAVPVDAVAADPAKFGGPVKVSGVIDSVCQVGGCWFVIRSEQDATRTIHITMKDRAFTVPPSVKGAKAIVAGTVAAPPAGGAARPGARMQITGVEVGI
jgi:hypothetical protein